MEKVGNAFLVIAIAAMWIMGWKAVLIILAAFLSLVVLAFIVNLLGF